MPRQAAMILVQFLALGAFAATVITSTRALRPSSLADALTTGFVSSYVTVFTGGVVLGSMGLVGRPDAWAVAGLVLWAASLVASRLAQSTVERPAVRQVAEGSTLPAWGLLLMAGTVAIVSAVNVIVMLGTAPSAWDALAYHLPKMAFAVQSGSFDLPIANYWAQQVHPSGSTTLFVFACVLGGECERLPVIWQFAGVMTAAAAVWTIVRRRFSDRHAADFAALLYLLTTQAVVQASTAGNDAILAALTGCGTAWLLEAAATARPRYLVLSGAAAGLGMATKASFALVLPLWASLGVYAWVRAPVADRRGVLAGAGAAVALALILTLPSGYVTNWARYGHLLGPETVVQEHTFEAASASSWAAGGARNLLRYAADSVSLDGLPRIGVLIEGQQALKSAMRTVLLVPGLDLESMTGARATFRFDRIASAHEVHAYLGIIGWTLMAPALLLALARPTRSDLRVLAWLGLGFVALQAWSGPYDPWRGRYFLAGAVFVAPLTAWWAYVRPPWLRWFRNAAIVVACGSAFTAVLLRSNRSVLPVRTAEISRPSVFTLDRISQMTANRPPYRARLAAFDSVVPAAAVVAVRLPADSFEFPLFGADLSRRILPAPAGSPLPRDPYDLLLFDQQLEEVRAGDLPLGDGWWLRAGPGR